MTVNGTKEPVDYTRGVRYEFMRGRQAVAAIRAFPVGYLPVGCLERHGDHLPMGLDTFKAAGVCRLVAQAVGGVVFPPHHYAGIHRMTATQLDRHTGEWGNIYTDATATAHLIDIAIQLRLAGVRVLVLYSGHYPGCQVDMLEEVAAHFASDPDLQVIPFAECMILAGDHAGCSETSFMLYLDKTLVDMTALHEHNYQDHGWQGERDPAAASVALGEEGVHLVIAHLQEKIQASL
jgi:creatinine amidohydrolase